MTVQIIPSATIAFFVLSTLATKLEQISAFSTSYNHGPTNTVIPSSPSLIHGRQHRIEATSVKYHGDIGNSRLFADASDTAVETADKQDDEEDAIPIDNAKTTPQFLAGLWRLIAKGNHLVRGESATVLFPEICDKMTSRFLNLVTAHLDSCKDVCDYFGISTTLQPFVQDGRVQGFTVKSFRNPDKDPNSMEFDYDPFWDDADDWNYEGIDAEYEKEEAEKNGLDGNSTAAALPEIVNKIPDDDEEIEQLSKDWVERICSDMGVCPFTSGSSMAGLPKGPVYYTTDRSSSFEDMYAVYWEEVVRVENQNERELSTTLLIAPKFCMDNVELFEIWSTTLTQPLAALGIEDIIQLVFFHPQWVFRDGGERGGEGAAANYARRSPWPMINILRTNQVRAAQKGIPTGLVYKQNEKTLSGLGVNKLEKMLRLRDWAEIEDVKVDRREIDALRVAQDFQETGIVKQEDASFANDAAPAANKVDGNQIEQGDLVNVLMDVIKQRLGEGEDGDGSPTRLSGPETSAAIMASDFVLKALDKLAEADETDDSDKAVGDS